MRSHSSGDTFLRLWFYYFINYMSRSRACRNTSMTTEDTPYYEITMTYLWWYVNGYKIWPLVFIFFLMNFADCSVTLNFHISQTSSVLFRMIQCLSLPRIHTLPYPLVLSPKFFWSEVINSHHLCIPYTEPNSSGYSTFLFRVKCNNKCLEYLTHINIPWNYYYYQIS